MIATEDLDFLRRFLKERSGIDLGADKTYLFETRLAPVAASHELADIKSLAGALRSNASSALAHAVVEAMTTNETFFFRDQTPFDHLRTVMLPELARARAGRPLRIWSAACSTGQEPYSIAMTLDEERGKHPRYTPEIIATDLAPKVLRKAEEGRYTKFEVQRGLKPETVNRYFEEHGGVFRAKAMLREMVSWRRVNLLENFSGLGRFDVIFARNVLIYFDRETRVGILDRMHRQLADDGYLVLGAAETVLGLHAGYAPAPGRPALFIKAGAANPPLARAFPS